MASPRLPFTPLLLRRHPSAARMGTLLAAVVDAHPTYPEVGATLDARLPAGYQHLQETTVLGRGAPVWARAADGLLDWGLHRGAGMVVAATAPAGVLGATMVGAAPLGPIAIGVACRVLAVIDEPTRRGFVYGTLPGHVVSGEERFTVELGDDGQVRFRLVSFSRPVGAAGLAPALVRAGQRRANRRFAAVARTLAG